MIYAWHSVTWQRLTDAFLSEQLPHALLFSGPDGVGKTAFVMEWVRFILCEHRLQLGEFCSLSTPCHACRLVQTEVHPNIHYVTPDKEGHAIKIDQLREMIAFSEQSGYMGKHQCIIINPAHQMNIFSANALLKTLEEPASGVFLFLVTAERSRLPATILSRTMHVDMTAPSSDESLLWLQSQSKKTVDEMLLALKIAVGAPLKALSLLQSGAWKTRQAVYQALHTLTLSNESFMQCAAHLQETDMSVLLDLLLSWTTDLLKIKCGVEIAQIQNHDYAETLIAFSSARSLYDLERALHQINLIRNEFIAGVHLNKTLSIENFLMHFLGKSHVFS